jgi:hypothetical protein
LPGHAATYSAWATTAATARHEISHGLKGIKQKSLSEMKSRKAFLILYLLSIKMRPFQIPWAKFDNSNNTYFC